MKYHIEGMDCASCIGKIETALKRMPGVSDVELNFATETLELSLTPGAPTQASDIEKTIISKKNSFINGVKDLRQALIDYMKS